MPSIRLMGFAAGTLFILSSAGHAQTPQAPGKALPTGQAPSKVLPHPQVSGKGLPSGYSDAGSTGYYDASGGYGTAGGGYYGGGYAGGTAGYPGGYDYRPARLQPGRPRRADVRAGRPPRRGLRRSGCRCGWGRRRPRRAGIRDRGAARPGRRRLGPRALTLPRSSDHPAAAPRPGPTGAVGGGRLMGAAAGEVIRTSTGGAGRHSGGDPALWSGRTDGSGWWASVPHRACGRRRRTTQRTDVGGGRSSLPEMKELGQLRGEGREFQICAVSDILQVHARRAGPLSFSVRRRQVSFHCEAFYRTISRRRNKIRRRQPIDDARRSRLPERAMAIPSVELAVRDRG